MSKEDERELRTAVYQARRFGDLSRADMHRVVDERVDQYEQDELAERTAVVNARTLTLRPLEVQVWPHHDGKNWCLHFPWMSDGASVSMSKRELDQWVDVGDSDEKKEAGNV